LLMLNNNHVEYIEKIFKKLYFASVNGIYFHCKKKMLYKFNSQHDKSITKSFSHSHPLLHWFPKRFSQFF